LCRSLLSRHDLPDGDQRRIAGNRDITAQQMVEAAASYPDTVVPKLVAGQRDSAVTVSLVAGPDLRAIEHTLNSFLHCCMDLSRVGRFVVLAAVLEAEQEVFQVGVKVDDATKLTGACAAEATVRRAAGAGRYVLGDAVATGPTMFETARLDCAGGIDGADGDLAAELGTRATAADCALRLSTRCSASPGDGRPIDPHRVSRVGASHGARRIC
jgi:hypothetical protein